MADPSGWMPVVAAAITCDDRRLLLQQRPPGKHHAGLWEFPGGKVEAGELPEAALVREIEEELGVRLAIDALQPVTFASGSVAHGGAPAILLLLYACGRWTGEPEGREGQRFGWFSPDEIAALAMPPLDQLLRSRFARNAL